jgi:hypothetical protein
MAAIKTINLLPAVFQTDTNRKFLNATLDQLISEPNFKKINGYVGRKFAPTFKAGDNYLIEPTGDRQNYQLEPSVVVENKSTETIDHYSGYIDLLQKIEYYGGNISNHSRLFDSESYTYNGLFDFDKFVNFNNYYWLPDGPATVDVFAGTVQSQETYTVGRNTAIGYSFSSNSIESNPVITLARGGVYRFKVNQPGSKFWIQSSPGVSGVFDTRPNASTRDVFGVQNNGADTGEVVFRVPLNTAQDRYISMPLVDNVDVSTSINYSKLQNRLLSELFVEFPGGIDGVKTNLLNKKLIFVNAGIDDVQWTNPNFATPPAGFNANAGYVVPEADRVSVWKIDLVPYGSDFIINLISYKQVVRSEKVFVKTGIVGATKEYFVDFNTVYSEVPAITATLDRLFYQDGNAPNLVGQIKLVDPGSYTIDVENDIIGSASYTSPNGVKFTNGLKISFDSLVVPAEYANNEYYIDGVGSSISLIKVSDLITPEPYAVTGLNTADYVTINRNSQDSNPWSRSNRWFHIDVIAEAAAYNNITTLPSQSQRASRPIIEFEKNLQLFNYGRVAKTPVDILDLTITDAFSDVEGSETYTLNGVVLSEGMRVVFAAETDPIVKNKIYRVTFIDVDGLQSTQTQIHLIEADDSTIVEGNTLIVLQGTNKGVSYWFNGFNWIEGQAKDAINQEPLFDVFDSDGNSFSNTDIYLNSSFKGTEIFSYKKGTGTNDTVLGFPLSYKNFNSVGDIEFDNKFDSVDVTYLSGQDTLGISVNSGFLRQYQGLDNFENRNVWSKITEKTKQYQIISTVHTGETNYIEIDILPETEKAIPYIKVFVNNSLLNSTEYSIKKVGVKQTVEILKSLSIDDKIDISIYSLSASDIGYYETPDNLEFNPLNLNFESLTLGQLRNHVDIIKQNTKVITDYNGTFTKLRDIDYKTTGGSLLQHGHPLVFSNIFLNDKNTSFVESLNFASKEYTKFKNKFLELATKLDEVDSNNIRDSVDAILKNINLVKNKSFPWYYSDMVPYGDNKNTLSYSIINPLIKQYEISGVFNDKLLSNRATLVYHNDVQLVKGKDYYFPQDRAAVIINDSVELVANDTLTVVEFVDTDGCYVPETPSKLGLYPNYQPALYFDDTYQVPVNVIRGHDGSITPAFNDYRDNLLLELEKRIYNNIKIDFETNILELYDFIPGKFRSTEYSLQEFNRVLTKSFLKWTGLNRVNFTNNDYFVENNAWTWNYKKLPDSINGAQLPGTWRAIYNYWFDTDRPHTHPWEMLGFSEEPSWWQDRYGAAPYTGGNTLLWDDLSRGYIHAGPRAGTDSRFKRPQLLNHVPVDEYGALISPEKFAVGNFDSRSLNTSFAVGDQGPVETAWRRSSDYPYALQQAIALLKPSFYFGALINISEYFRDSTIDQLVRSDTKQRITPTTVCIHGESMESGEIQRCSGYLNWITDFVHSRGITGAEYIRQIINNIDVRLSYKVAGYTDQKYIKVLAEQSSPTSTNNSIIIPDENYRVHLHKSSQVKKATYSAVIIERSENGYTVSGYDISNPFFTIVPSLANNNTYSITAINQKAVIYKDFQSRKVTIPYGFEFKTRQQVVDFLVSYGRYLTGLGYRFDETDESLKSQRDWILSAREFLTWSQQGWTAGSLIILSPIFNSVKFISNAGVVDFVENASFGSRIIDHNFGIIKNNQFSVVRDSNQFNLTAINNQTIGLIELDVVQYEHALLFDNTTVFNDVIYKPELGNRQYRLKIVGNKTADWTGNLNPPGFVYNSPSVDTWQPGVDYRKGAIVNFKEQYYTALVNVIASAEFDRRNWQMIDRLTIKTGLLPNFAYNAQKFENIYDIDNQPVDGGLDDYSNGLIGFRNRSYLSDFSLDQISQAKFYQGYIKQKGTVNAITGLTNAQFNNITSDINIYEEWAIRVGEYGALESDQSLEVVLHEDLYTNDPSGVIFADNIDNINESGFVTVQNKDLYRRPEYYKKNIFFDRDEDSNYANDSLTAGYVNLNDVDGTLYYFSYYADLDVVINNLGKGYKLWVARNFDDVWDVYRVNESNLLVTSLTYDLDGFMTVELSNPHDLSVGDIFAFKNFNPQFNGFYQVAEITGTKTISVFMHKNEEILKNLQTVTGRGAFFTLESVRVERPTDIVGITPDHGWIDGDRVWINNYSNNKWAVLEKTSPWELKDYVAPQISEYANNLHFGVSSKISSTTDLIVAGAPGKNEVKTFTKTSSNEFIQTNTLRPQNDLIQGFGSTLDVSDYIVAVSAPDSFDNQGVVYVFSVGPTGGFTGQIIVDYLHGVANSKFGSSLAISQDNQWLYIGCSGDNCVYAYRLVTDLDIKREEILANGTDTEFTLSFTPISTSSITISTNNKRYIPNLEYKVVGDVISFYNGDGITPIAPVADTLVVSQSPYYNFNRKIEAIDAEIGDLFGASVATNYDGSEVYIGAPEQTIDGKIRSGSVYVYARRSQSFRTVAGINTFITHEPSTEDTVVMLNNTVQIPGVDYQVIDSAIRFNDAPESGRIVTITQSSLDFVQKLTQDVPTQNSKFGTTIAVDSTSSSLFVGAPLYSEPNYQNGLVYRFTDPAKITGYAVGSIANPTVTVGNAIYINGFRIQFFGTTVEDVVNDINNANLPGVSATVVAGKLSITSSNISSTVKLTFRDYGNTALAELGLEPYQLSQSIKHPDFGKGENFGQRVAINDTGTTLLVSSEKASTFKPTTIDNDTTTFDKISTFFVDQVKNSGAVYQYELLKNTVESIADVGDFVYAQQLMSAKINGYDNYGASIDIGKTFSIVGAPLNDEYTVNGGIIHLFENVTDTASWKIIRQQQPKVDIDSVNRLFVYDKSKNTIINNLDYIDPVKGKILGVAEQDIDYKTTFDPATYNAVAGWADQQSTYNSNYYWGNQQVGSIWWDLSTIRYVEYEQDSLTYRQRNWGSLFPGSSVDVYEWVESNVLPSVYQEQGGDGQPLWQDNEAYSIVTNVDESSGVITTKYYFWVKNKKNTAPKGKNNSTSSIANIIENPQLQGIPYATVLASNAIGLVGVKDLLRSSDIVLHIDYANIRNSNTIHSEFELISDNTNVLPEKIIDKLIDSLAGLDRLGQVVPDNTLSEVDRLGIGIRPRQTMVANRAAALENFVRYANGVFAKHPISVLYNLNNLYSEEPLPDNTTGNQWNITAATAEELSYIDTDPLAIGYKVLVEADSTHNNLWTIYTLTEAGFTLSRIQSYKTDLYWKKVNWYANNYDPSTKINYLVNEFKDISKIRLVAGTTIKVRYGSTGQFEIYVVNSDLSLTLVGLENGTIELLDIIYNLSKGKMSYDQDNYDNIRYDQTPSLEIRRIVNAIKNDIFVGELKGEFNKLFFIVIDYILAEQKNVDWIFKTSFINVVHKLRKLEQFPSFIKDNQDYYLEYINEVKPYRTQIREYLLNYSGDDFYYGDVTDFDLPSYYDTATKTYRSPSGEKAGDSVRLNQSKYSNWKNGYTYNVDSIDVDAPGSGFITTPEIKIVGGGGTGATAEAYVNFATGEISSIEVTNTGSGYTSTPSITINGTGVGAKAYARLTNSKTRKVNSTLKFDRTTYSSSVVEWQPNVTFTTNTVVSFDGVAWRANANIASLDYFDYTNFVKLTGDYFENAADRITAYYQPTVGSVAADLPQLLKGIEYPGVKVQGLKFNSNVDFAANAALIDTYIQSTYTDANLGIRAEDINIDGGAYVDTYSSHAPEELVPGIVFDSLNLEVYTREIDANANVIPGGTTVGLRIVHGMLRDTSYYRIPGSNVTTLSSNLSIADSFIHVNNAAVLPNPGFELAESGTWIVIPGVVFINGEKLYYYKNYNFAQQWTANLAVDAGSEIAYNGNVYVTQGNVYETSGNFANISANVTLLTTTNSLGQIRRAVDGTGAPLVHLANIAVVDSSKVQEIYFGNDSWVNSWSSGNTTVGNISATFINTGAVTNFLMQNPSLTP